MLETIFSWLTEGVGQALTWVVKTFLDVLDLSLGTFVTIFPAFSTAYTVFQSISIGLIILIAGISLMSFFMPGITKPKETPPAILFKAGIAGALVYFGGYFVEWFVDLAKIPYDVFLSLLKAQDIKEESLNFAETVENLGSNAGSAGDASAIALGAAAVTIIALILLLIISWNILKLMLEVVERYLMVGFLAYTSPLIYSTLASTTTSHIFRRWVSMFFGQCLLMFLSVFSFHLILSGFIYSQQTADAMAEGTAPYWLRIIVILAMCKIAQRLDSYLQQIGIGTATTGQNLWDDIVATAMTMGRLGRNAPGRAGNNGGPNSAASGKDSSVLGSQTRLDRTASPASWSRMGGLVGMASNYLQRGVSSFQDGKSLKESFFSPESAKAAAMGAFPTVSKGAAVIANHKFNKGKDALKEATGEEVAVDEDKAKDKYNEFVETEDQKNAKNVEGGLEKVDLPPYAEGEENKQANDGAPVVPGEQQDGPQNPKDGINDNNGAENETGGLEKTDIANDDHSVVAPVPSGTEAPAQAEDGAGDLSNTTGGVETTELAPGEDAEQSAMGGAEANMTTGVQDQVTEADPEGPDTGGLEQATAKPDMEGVGAMAATPDASGVETTPIKPDTGGIETSTVAADADGAPPAGKNHAVDGPVAVPWMRTGTTTGIRLTESDRQNGMMMMRGTDGSYYVTGRSDAETARWATSTMEKAAQIQDPELRQQYLDLANNTIQNANPMTSDMMLGTAQNNFVAPYDTATGKFQTVDGKEHGDTMYDPSMRSMIRGAMGEDFFNDHGGESIHHASAVTFKDQDGAYNGREMRWVGMDDEGNLQGFRMVDTARYNALSKNDKEAYEFESVPTKTGGTYYVAKAPIDQSETRISSSFIQEAGSMAGADLNGRVDYVNKWTSRRGYAAKGSGEGRTFYEHAKDTSLEQQAAWKKRDESRSRRNSNQPPNPGKDKK